MMLYLVQDALEDRLARQDGSHVILPAGTLLPLCKANKIKLKKDSDGPLEFVAEDLPHPQVVLLCGIAGWEPPPAPPEPEPEVEPTAA